MDTQTHTPASQHSTRKKLLLTCSNLLHSPQFSTDTATASKTSLELQTLNHVVLRSHNKCAQPSKMRCMPAAKTQSGSLILTRHRKTTLSGQKQFQNTSRTAKPLQPLVCCRDSGQAPAVHDASMAPRILLRCGHGDDARSPDHTAFTCSPCSHICLSAMRHSSTPQSPRHTSLPTYHHKTCKPGLSTACFNTCTPPGGFLFEAFLPSRYLKPFFLGEACSIGTCCFSLLLSHYGPQISLIYIYISLSMCKPIYII